MVAISCSKSVPPQTPALPTVSPSLSPLAFQIQGGGPPAPPPCDCKATGGGTFDWHGTKVSFGFVANHNEKNEKTKGQLQIVYHSQPPEKYHGVVDDIIYCKDGWVVFTGTKKGTSERFYTSVFDDGEPATKKGNQDVFIFDP
jgi:hypothetical protein